MDGHLGLLEGLLLSTELVPRERAIHLTGSKDFKMLGKMIRRAEFSLGLRECPARDSEFLDSAPPLGADSVPTYLVAGFALCDVFRKSVQRKMRGRECDILKKWSASVISRVVLEMVNGGISYRDSPIVTRAPLNGREFHIVLPMCLWTEEAALVLKVIGMLKAVAEGHSVKVPLARVITAVACLFESHGNKWGPVRPAPSGFSPRQVITADLLSVVAGEQCGPRGPASRRIVKLGITEPFIGQAVEVGSLDLSSIASQIGVAEIVGHDQQHVGRGRCCCQPGEAEEEENRGPEHEIEAL